MSATLTGRKVFYWLFGFFFVVCLFNGIMVYFALATFSGIETEDAYRKGRAYNEVLEEARTQAALGWQATAKVESKAVGNGLNAVVTVAISDRGGAPLPGLNVDAEFWRPTAKGFDRTVSLESVGSGRYKGGVELAAAGNWQLRVTARGTGGERFFMKKQVILKP